MDITAARRYVATLAVIAVAVLDAVPAGAAAQVPLSDLRTDTYLGFQGGLYPNGSNSMPASHRAAGINKALRVRPVDTSGNPDPNGKYVMLSIGMSNTTQEFCAASSGQCAAYSFMGKAAADPQVNHTKLVIGD